MDDKTSGYGRRLLHRWLVEYNPLYVFSAALVLAGMFLLSRGLTRDDGAHVPLGIAAISQVYAAALIGGAAFLMRIGQRRPAVMLGLLTALYQCDLTLHTETCVWLGEAGAWASAGWLALFVAKLYALAWALRLRLSPLAAATATLGALGLAALPHLLHRFDARSASALVAIWIFALGSLHRFAVVTSAAPLGDWARVVLRRSIRATWVMWALLGALHVLFWSSEHPLRPGALLAVVPFLWVRGIRSELRMWAGAGAALGLVAVVAPPFFFLAAIALAATLAMRALLGVESAVVRAADPAEVSPYRASSDAPAAPAVVVEVERVAVSAAAKARLFTGAALATYLGVWTLGWSGGAWPAHELAFDAAAATALLLLAWRLRTRVPLFALGAAGAELVVQARLVPAPRSPLEWGVVCVALGFVSLLVGLVASWRLRERAPEVEELLHSPGQRIS